MLQGMVFVVYKLVLVVCFVALLLQQPQVSSFEREQFFLWSSNLVTAKIALNLEIYHYRHINRSIVGI